MIGMDRSNGRVLTGWEHVCQSLDVIFTTRFHERLMRRWFGSLVPHMLGENMTPPTVLRFMYSVAVAIELWEPRFKLVKVTPIKVDRSGEFDFRLDGEYFPNATMGDYLTKINKTLVILARNTGLVVGPFDGAN